VQTLASALNESIVSTSPAHEYQDPRLLIRITLTEAEVIDQPRQLAAPVKLSPANSDSNANADPQPDEPGTKCNSV
jgi:hypothetical protein